MSRLHPAADIPLEMLSGLEYLAREMAKAGLKRYHETHRRRIGSTLRPGPETPLWNALVASTRPCLRRHGEKALLARELGVYPSRVTEYFVKQQAMPDAERTLLLLQYILRRTGGRNRS